MIYEILDEKNGEVINAIVAEKWFVDKYYSGRYREYIEPEPLEEEGPEISEEDDTEKQ